MFGLALILLCIISVFSFLTYDYLKKIYIREAYEKTDLVLGHIDDTMEYARDELRPQIFHTLPGNVFIRQVMSSSFINMGIMNRFWMTPKIINIEKITMNSHPHSIPRSTMPKCISISSLLKSVASALGFWIVVELRSKLGSDFCSLIRVSQRVCEAPKCNNG